MGSCLVSQKIVTSYSIQTYFLYCYAIFISEDVTRQRGGVNFGIPCISRMISTVYNFVRF